MAIVVCLTYNLREKKAFELKVNNRRPANRRPQKTPENYTSRADGISETKAACGDGLWLVL
jgi:hypothetical protein